MKKIEVVAQLYSVREHTLQLSEDMANLKECGLFLEETLTQVKKLKDVLKRETKEELDLVICTELRPRNRVEKN